MVFGMLGPLSSCRWRLGSLAGEGAQLGGEPAPASAALSESLQEGQGPRLKAWHRQGVGLQHEEGQAVAPRTTTALKSGAYIDHIKTKLKTRGV